MSSLRWERTSFAPVLRHWKRCVAVPLTCAMLAMPFTASTAQTAKASAGTPLRIYFIDTEGGQSTLFVLPNHTSLLVDTGFPGRGARDATRIMRAAKLAGIDRIDYMLFTHYHVDHVGGLPELMERIPIGTFIDHGPNHEPDVPATAKGYDEYQKVLATGKYKQITAKPGDKLPIPGADFVVVSSDGNVIDKPLPGAGHPNPTCSEPDTPPADVDFTKDVENGRSLGFLMTFGKLRILDVGDLWWAHERELTCPVNKLGHINLLVVNHHASQPSNSPVFVNAITPQVAIMDNGERKGGAPRVLQLYKDTPSHPAVWQLHYAAAAGDALNTDPAMIANLLSAAGKAALTAPPPAPGTRRPEMPPDEGYMITVEAYANGKFKVTNERNGESRDYTAH